MSLKNLIHLKKTSNNYWGVSKIMKTKKKNHEDDIHMIELWEALDPVMERENAQN